MSDDIVVSLPSCVWERVYSIVSSEIASLSSRAKGVEGLYGEILRNEAQELSVALQEIESNLTIGQKDAIN